METPAYLLKYHRGFAFCIGLIIALVIKISLHKIIIIYNSNSFEILVGAKF